MGSLPQCRFKAECWDSPEPSHRSTDGGRVGENERNRQGFGDWKFNGSRCGIVKFPMLTEQNVQREIQGDCDIPPTI